jgi:hypothetical protein
VNWPHTHFPLDKLNSITKYPSIQTIHVMGERGRLTNEVPVNFDPTEDWTATEKIDGTNARVVITRYGDFIGSREELLTFTHDVVRNPSLGIVETVLPGVLATTTRDVQPPDEVLVLWGEVYGGNIGKAAKNYSATGARAFRLFDAALFPEKLWLELHKLPIEEISRWRDTGGQPFVSRAEFEGWSAKLRILPAPVSCKGTGPLPVQLDHTAFWLGQTLDAKTGAGIDAHGSPEGLIVRSRDRTKIVKLRTEDYARSVRPPTRREQVIP